MTRKQRTDSNVADDKKSKDEASVSNDMAALIAAFTESIKGVALQPEQIKELIAGVAHGTQKALRPENQVHPHVSVYSHPEGDIARPKPTLVRDTYFCGIKEEEDRLTPGEIEAYNAIAKPMECRGGSWRAEIKRSQNIGGKEALFVWVPHNTADQRNVLPPSLLLLLTELNGGPSTENLMDLIRQIETLKAMLVKKGSTVADLEQALLAS